MGHPKQNRFKADALCLTEQRIIALWDAGHAFESIVHQTGYTRNTVSDTVSRLHEGNETRLHLAAMRSGSTALAAALAHARQAGR